MEKNYILPFLWMKGESQEVIREEIEKIDECGIKAICLESRPHPDFMGEKWWEDLTFIIEEAKKRNMKIWILDDAHFPTGYANGLVKEKYPERRKRYLNYNVVNVWGKNCEISVNIKQMTKPLVSFLELDKPMDFEERAKNELVAVVAYPMRSEKKLDEVGAIDLTDKVRGDYLSCRLPQDNYRIFVVYETCTDGGNPDYINMMDKESVSTLLEAIYEPHYEHFKEEFGKTIAGFFSDEPEIGNKGGYSSDVQIGNPNMPLPWSRALMERFAAVHGEDYRKVLPLLWTETVQMQACPQVRHSFMDIVTSLYQENFSCQLGDWCKEHQVEYIGHVVEDDNLHQRLGSGTGHYFRAMAGQHMAGIDVIGDQVTIGDQGYVRSGLFERSGSFFHYALAKMGASAGHLDPKKQGRTMCELFGASGWETGVRDMKYILDHLLVRGINYLVPHAFSMAEYPDADCPPHFYARGKNPQFKYFAKLMKYANRMCDKLNGGTHVASVAVLYTAESEWSGKAMTIDAPAKELQEHQIEFDFVWADMLGNLADYHGSVEKYCEITNNVDMYGAADELGQCEAEVLKINGQQFQWLVIPEGEYLTAQAYEFIKAHPGVKVIFVNQKPKGVAGNFVGAEELEKTLANGIVVALEELGSFLQQQKVETVKLQKPFEELVYYHYEKNGDIYVFQNESAFDIFQGEIELPINHEAIYYDGMEDKYYRLPVKEENGVKTIALELHPYGLGMVLDVEAGVLAQLAAQQVNKSLGAENGAANQNETELPEYQMLSEKLADCAEKKKIEGAWTYAIATEEKFPWFMEPGVMEELKPISHLIPEFSGHISYEKEIEIDGLTDKAYLEFTEVYEAIELWVNGTCVGSVQYPPYVFEISDYLREGKNQIKAIVTSTLDRDQVNYPEPFIRLDYHVTEPAGLAGEVILHR